MSNYAMCMTCCKFNEDKNERKYRLVQNSDVILSVVILLYSTYSKRMLITVYVDQVVKDIKLYKSKFP